MAAAKTEDYQLLGEVLDQGLKKLGYSREDLSVELFASDKQHVLDLYCSGGKNCCYKFYWPSFGMAYGNPRFSAYTIGYRYAGVQHCSVAPPHNRQKYSKIGRVPGFLMV